MAKQLICTETDCPYPRYGRKRTCGWHFAERQNIEWQVEAAMWRLGQAEATGRPHRARVPAAEWPEGERWCAGCQSFVPLFYTTGSRCRACASRAAHRARAEAGYDWPPGVTYDSLLALQGGRCAICRRVPRTKRLAIDHDHKTGLVRGLLCPGERGCNHGLLGSAHDDANILAAAYWYLVSPPSGAGGQVVP